MAGQFDVHFVTNNIGLTAGTTLTPLLKNITSNGGITILDANIWSGGAGTMTAMLVYTDPTGGTVGGTIATLGSAAQVFVAAGTAALVIAGTVTSGFVPPNKTVSVQLGAGTAGSNTCVTVAYIKGQ